MSSGGSFVPQKGLPLRREVCTLLFIVFICTIITHSIKNSWWSDDHAPCAGIKYTSQHLSDEGVKHLSELQNLPLDDESFQSVRKRYIMAFDPSLISQRSTFVQQNIGCFPTLNKLPWALPEWKTHLANISFCNPHALSPWEFAWAETSSKNCQVHPLTVVRPSGETLGLLISATNGISKSITSAAYSVQNKWTANQPASWCTGDLSVTPSGLIVFSLTGSPSHLSLKTGHWTETGESLVVENFSTDRKLLLSKNDGWFHGAEWVNINKPGCIHLTEDSKSLWW